MRCRACNVELTDAESTMRTTQNEYLDMCNECLNASRTKLTSDEDVKYTDWAEFVLINNILDEDD